MIIPTFCPFGSSAIILFMVARKAVHVNLGNKVKGGKKVESKDAEEQYDCLSKYGHDLLKQAAEGDHPRSDDGLATDDHNEEWDERVS